MQQIIIFCLGIFVLILAYPIGILLKKYTLDEQKIGRPWFILITWISLVAGLTGLIIKKDWLMFTSFFIAIVTSQSLKSPKN